MITAKYGSSIKDWILDNLDFIKKQPNSKPKGHRGVVFGMPEIQDPDTKELLIANGFPYGDLISIEEELINHFRLPTRKYADLGIMFVYCEKGYKCTWHTDDTDNQHEYTTRLNVLLSKPEEGGEPILKKKGVEEVIPVKENEPWICVAGKYEHSTVKTKGDTPRILLSFGYDVPKLILESLGEI